VKKGDEAKKRKIVIRIADASITKKDGTPRLTGAQYVFFFRSTLRPIYGSVAACESAPRP
jgi:hypothetical protein